MEKRLKGLCQPLNLPGSAASPPARLRIPVGSGKLSLAVSEIVRLEGEGAYSWIHTSGGQRYLVSWTLAMVMLKLPQLVRIHKSHLVSPAYIEKLTTYKGRRWLRLTTGEKLPLSRRLCSSFIPIPFPHEPV